MALYDALKKKGLDIARKAAGLDGSQSSGITNEYAPSDLLAWVNDPANQSHPYYQQALALAKSAYNGPGKTPLDFLYSIFGDTPNEQGISQHKQYLNDSWRELLGQINEYNINTPANLARLSKQAGYNVDLNGVGQGINTDTDNPVTPPNYGGISGGREMLGNVSNVFMNLIGTAFSLYQSGLNIKSTNLQNEIGSQQLSNLKNQGKGILLDLDEKEINLQDSARTAAEAYALSALNGTFIYDPKKDRYVEVNGEGEQLGDLSLELSLDEFLKKDNTTRNRIASAILDKAKHGDFPYSTFSNRNRKRFLEDLERYVYSPQFGTVAFKAWNDRTKAYNEAVRLAGSKEQQGETFAKSLEPFRELYELEFNALKGDYSKRIYQSGQEEIIFNEKKFRFDMQSTMRDVLSGIKAKADAGDDFSKYLLFTMVTDPSYFEQINTLVGGISDFITDGFGSIIKPFGKLFGKASKKGAKYTPKSGISKALKNYKNYVDLPIGNLKN